MIKHYEPTPPGTDAEHDNGIAVHTGLPDSLPIVNTVESTHGHLAPSWLADCAAKGGIGLLLRYVRGHKKDKVAPAALDFVATVETPEERLNRHI